MGLRLAIRDGAPIIDELALRAGEGTDWVPLATDARVEYSIVEGLRRINNQQLRPLRELGVELTSEVVDRYLPSRTGIVIAPFPAVSHAANRIHRWPVTSTGMVKVREPNAGWSVADSLRVVVRSPSPMTTSTIDLDLTGPEERDPPGTRMGCVRRLSS